MIPPEYDPAHKDFIDNTYEPFAGAVITSEWDRFTRAPSGSKIIMYQAAQPCLRRLLRRAIINQLVGGGINSGVYPGTYSRGYIRVHTLGYPGTLTSMITTASAGTRVSHSSAHTFETCAVCSSGNAVHANINLEQSTARIRTVVLVSRLTSRRNASKGGIDIAKASAELVLLLM